MTKETLQKLIKKTIVQCPSKIMFQDGTRWTSYMEARTAINLGVDEEIVAGQQTIRCLYVIVKGEWTMISINEVPVEECIG